MDAQPGSLLVGKSLQDEPVFTQTTGESVVIPIGGTTLQAVVDLRRYADEGALRHDDSPDLTSQILDLRTSASPNGPRLRGGSRADAVKAAAWFASRLRSLPEAPAIF